MFDWRSIEPLTAAQCRKRAIDWLDDARQTEDPSTRKMLTDLADNWAFLAERRGQEERRLRVGLEHTRHSGTAGTPELRRIGGQKS